MAAAALASEPSLEETETPDLDLQQRREPPVSLSIAEVRKSLAYLRRRWEESQAQDSAAPPYYLCEEIELKEKGRIASDVFSLRFVLAHHQKRRSSK